MAELQPVQDGSMALPSTSGNLQPGGVYPSTSIDPDGTTPSQDVWSTDQCPQSIPWVKGFTVATDAQGSREASHSVCIPGSGPDPSIHRDLLGSGFERPWGCSRRGTCSGVHVRTGVSVRSPTHSSCWTLICAPLASCCYGWAATCTGRKYGVALYFGECTAIWSVPPHQRWSV